MGEQLEERIEPIEDVPLLQRLVVKAAQVSSLDEFQMALDELVGEPEDDAEGL